MKQEWLAFLSAVQFLTRLPVPEPGWEDGRLDRAAKWFPLVGVLVGASSGAVVLLAMFLGQSSTISVIVAVVAAVMVTGALHEDGLADRANGFGGGRDRAHALTIMKDSSIGAYGAIALVLAFALRIALYQDAVLGAQSSLVLIGIFIAAHCVGRAGMVGIVWSLEYARDSDSAKVAPLTAPVDRLGMVVAVAVVLMAVLPVSFAFGIGAGATGIGVAAFAALALRGLYSRKLGGWTGDTAGATQVVCEIAFLMGVTAWI